MHFTNPKSILLFLVLIVFSLPGCRQLEELTRIDYHYRMPDASWVSGKDLCGQKKCDAGSSTGVSFQFRKNPYPPQIQESTTPEEAAYQVIGRIIREGDVSGGRPFDCIVQPQEPHPFSPDDIETAGSSNGRESEYTRTERVSSSLDVNAAVESGVNLISPSLEESDIPGLKAKLNAAYSAVSGSTVEIKSTYFEYELDQTEQINLFQRNVYPGCENAIRNGYRIITAAGLLTYDLNYKSSSVQEALAELEGFLRSKQVSVDMKAVFDKNAGSSLDATTGNGFQVIFWRHAGPADFFQINRN